MLDVPFGPVAVFQTNSTLMAAFSQKVDTRSRRMSALANTGRSQAVRQPIQTSANGQKQPSNYDMLFDDQYILAVHYTFDVFDSSLPFR